MPAKVEVALFTMDLGCYIIYPVKQDKFTSAV